jgi:hypothetical protein
MKITVPNRFARRENGMATILFITLLAIMVILVTANLKALAHLSREEKLLEQQQIQRLISSPTNSIPASEAVSK